MTAKISVNYVTNLIFCEVITNSLGRDIYFKTILDYPKKKGSILDTGLGGCTSGPVVKNYKVVPDTFRISGFWTRKAFNKLIKALKKSGAEIKTEQESI